MKGCWTSAEDVPDFLQDFERFLAEIHDEFVIITDFSLLQILPEDIIEICEKICQKFMNTRVSQMIQILPKSVFAELQIQSLNRKIKITPRVAKNILEANTILDQRVKIK